VVIVTVLLPLKWVWTHIVWPELLNWSRRHLFVYEEDVTDVCFFFILSSLALITTIAIANGDVKHFGQVF